MSYDSNTTDLSAFVRPARALREAYGRRATMKSLGLAFAVLLALFVSFALALLTSSSLDFGVNPLLIVGVATLIHLANSAGVHFYIVGKQVGDFTKRTWGIALITLAIVALLIMTAYRAQVWIAEGENSAVSYGKSVFLALIEWLVPAVVGVVAAMAHISWMEAAAKAGFFRDHERNISTSHQPTDRWRDAELRKLHEIREAEQALRIAQPEDGRHVERRLDFLNDTYRVLREWDPGRSYDEEDGAESTARVEVAPVAPSTGNSQAIPRGTIPVILNTTNSDWGSNA